jgi:hypothetical protein
LCSGIVRVPVLSEQIADTEPTASTAGRRPGTRGSPGGACRTSCLASSQRRRGAPWQAITGSNRHSDTQIAEQASVALAA